MPNVSPMLYVRMTNYYKVRDALMRTNRLWRGAFANQIRRTLYILRNYSSFITHRESGTLAKAHRVYYDTRRMRGWVYPSPAYAKERYKGKVQFANVYAVFEHARGGGHAFYARALEEMGPEVAMSGLKATMATLPLPRKIG